MISGFKSDWKQGLLWDQPLGNHGHARTVIGEFAEELTVQFLGGRRHRTDSRCSYCPDVSVGRVYYEVKAAGKTRQTFIYGGRLLKDRDFAKENQLIYIIWHHLAASKDAATVSELRALVLAKMQCVYLVPFSAIDSICSLLVPDRLNSNYGASRTNPMYGSGFRIPLGLLEPYIHQRWNDGGQVPDSSLSSAPQEAGL